jgi:hypothetical protein
MAQFGKRENLQHDPISRESEALVVVENNWPKYLTLLAAALLVIYLVHGILTGNGNYWSLLWTIPPGIILIAVLYLSFRGLQNEHRQQAEKRRVLARHPQLYFLGAAAGLAWFGLTSGATVGDMLREDWRTALGFGVFTGLNAPQSLWMQAAESMGAGLVAAYGIAKGLEWWKGRSA